MEASTFALAGSTPPRPRGTPPAACPLTLDSAPGLPPGSLPDGRGPERAGEAGPLVTPSLDEATTCKAFSLVPGLARPLPLAAPAAVRPEPAQFSSATGPKSGRPLSAPAHPMPGPERDGCSPGASGLDFHGAETPRRQPGTVEPPGRTPAHVPSPAHADARLYCSDRKRAGRTGCPSQPKSSFRTLSGAAS